MSGVAPEVLVARYPELYHMAWEGSWPSIRRRGLLSTSALLDELGIVGEQRDRLESQHRRDSMPLDADGNGNVVVRDQKPMGDSGLLRALQDGLTPREWYRTLNQFVFFWVTRERLGKLLNAKAYRDLRQVVVTVDTQRLLDRHADRVVLCPINSGCTKPFPHPRGRDTFLPLDSYPFDYWVRKRGKSGETVVELAVRGGVPDIEQVAVRVDEYENQRPVAKLWSR